MRRTLISTMLLVLAATSCGSGSSEPVALPTEDLPFDVTRGTEAAATGTTTRQEVTFVLRARLHTVNRRISAEQPPAEALLRALLEGPTRREIDRGIETMIPTTTKLLGVFLDEERIAHVDLSGEFQSAAPSETIVLRVAQVVWTLTEQPDILGVRFAIDGEPVTAVNAAGEPIDRPAARSDFQTLAPR